MIPQLNIFPLYQILSAFDRILIAGAGGGFDLFCGLPLAFALRRAGKQVDLASLTFSRFTAITGRKLGPNVVEVTATTPTVGDYFPELYLSQWLARRGHPDRVFCLSKSGVRPMAASYGALTRELRSDAVVLVDGGIDILLRGDESSLGTPAEDAVSLGAVNTLQLPTFVVCLGFGTDARHDVCHSHALQAIAELDQAGAFLGAVALLSRMPEVAEYMEATQDALRNCGGLSSYVSSAVLASLEGRFGTQEAVEGLRDQPPWISPLLTILWAFELPAVAQRCLYLDLIARTETIAEVTLFIRGFRKGLNSIRTHERIPI